MSDEEYTTNLHDAGRLHEHLQRQLSMENVEKETPVLAGTGYTEPVDGNIPF